MTPRIRSNKKRYEKCEYCETPVQRGTRRDRTLRKQLTEGPNITTFTPMKDSKVHVYCTKCCTLGEYLARLEKVGESINMYEKVNLHNYALIRRLEESLVQKCSTWQGELDVSTP